MSRLNRSSGHGTGMGLHGGHRTSSIQTSRVRPLDKLMLAPGGIAAIGPPSRECRFEKERPAAILARRAGGGRMPVDALLQLILCDEALTRGLGDAEARVLIEWLVEHAEKLAEAATPGAAAEVRRVCRRGRAIARFVGLWCGGERGGACQLAAAERFTWPLPATAVDACELMQHIVEWEQRQLRRGPLSVAG